MAIPTSGAPRRLALATLVCVLALLRASAQPAPSGSSLRPDSVVEKSGGVVVTYTLNVTLAWGAPSCFARPIMLISGIFQPAIEINQGDTLRINLANQVPASFPMVSDGISLHFHGLRMPGPAAWYDGVSYISLCPIVPGSSYTFQFKVDDPPGTYFYHDHEAGFKADGLQGALIVRPPRLPRPAPAPGAPKPPPPPPPAAAPAQPDLWQPDGGEATLFLSDWYHATAASLLFRLNQPFDAARVTNDSGAFAWIGNPQAVLVNGRGYYGDCALLPGGGGGAAPACAPSAFTVAPGRSVQQPWASNNNPGCTHSVIPVQPGRTHRLRLVNAGTLVSLTVCFEAHSVALVAADAMPTQPLNTSCLDLNSGQRMDVLLTADQPPANYWITVAAQYRPGSPAGYAVLHYLPPAADAAAAANASSSSAANISAAAFPTTPPPQPGSIAPWGVADDAKVVMDERLLAPSNKSELALYRHPGQATLAPPLSAHLAVVVNITQPLTAPDGQIRWALGNVAMPNTPPCTPLLAALRKDPLALQKAAVPAATVNGTGAGPNVGIGYAGPARTSPVYLDGVSPVPLYPSVGLRIVQIGGGQVVDLIVNNRPANEHNGDYRPNGVGAARVAVEQHPFHLHGHKFWVLGRGANGTFDPAAHGALLNLANPPLRDTATISAGGWAVLRFVSDNPGVWPFHCHILPHIFMGQQLYIVEDIGNIAAPPSSTPKCPNACRYNFAPYTKSWMRAKYGVSGWELPPLW